MPDFCPASSSRRPPGSVTSIGEAPKSQSGPFESAQLVLSGSRHAAVYASFAVICLCQRIRPVSRSMATNASLIGEPGSL